MADVAIVLGPDFEDSEFTVPRARLAEAGHDVVVFGRRAGETLEGKRGKARAVTDVAAGDLEPEGFHALVIPGGFAPDRLRMDESVVRFVKAFGALERPIAAICHGPQLLIEAGLVRGRTLTSWPSVRTDLLNAGAQWVDQEVVEDGTLITSRKPDDLDAFCEVLLKRLA